MILFGCGSTSIITVLATLAPNVEVFILVRFVQGALSSTLWQIPFVLGKCFRLLYSAKYETLRSSYGLHSLILFLPSPISLSFQTLYRKLLLRSDCPIEQSVSTKETLPS